MTRRVLSASGEKDSKEWKAVNTSNGDNESGGGKIEGKINEETGDRN